jgi:hypothetical protein
MQNPEFDKESPTARQRALARRMLEMSEVLGMQVPLIVFESERKPEDLTAPIGEEGPVAGLLRP